MTAGSQPVAASSLPPAAPAVPVAASSSGAHVPAPPLPRRPPPTGTGERHARAWRRTARTFFALVSRDLQTTLTYRTWLIWLMLSNLPTPVISLLVWHEAAKLGAPLPVPQHYLVSYFVLVALVNTLASSWSARFLAESIRLGELANWLVRPCSTHLNGVANNVGEKLGKLAVMVPMVAVLGLLAHRWLAFPAHPIRWLGFGIAIVLAAAINFCLDIVIGSLAFWCEDVTGFLRARSVISAVLSGAIVPLALMPAALGPVLRIQPFRFVLSFPLEVLLGPTGPLPAGFALQAGWLALISTLAAVVWRRGLRAYQGAGG